jgi:hypothetical protein
MTKPTLRSPGQKKERISAEQRSGFVSEADYTPEKPPQKRSTTRNYKAVNVGMNQTEWEKLEQACEITGLSKKAFFRTSMLEKAKAVLK